MASEWMIVVQQSPYIHAKRIISETIGPFKTLDAAAAFAHRHLAGYTIVENARPKAYKQRVGVA
jgi:hypothetical protein